MSRSRTSSYSRQLTTLFTSSSTQLRSRSRLSETSSLIAVRLLTEILDRYERNNFFVAADTSVIDGNHRLFNIESPYTQYVSAFNAGRLS